MELISFEKNQIVQPWKSPVKKMGGKPHLYSLKKEKKGKTKNKKKSKNTERGNLHLFYPVRHHTLPDFNPGVGYPTRINTSTPKPFPGLLTSQQAQYFSISCFLWRHHRKKGVLNCSRFSAKLQKSDHMKFRGFVMDTWKHEMADRFTGVHSNLHA